MKTVFFNLSRLCRASYALLLVLSLVTATAATAQTFSTLVSFDGTNGATPYYMSLVQGEDGNLYGTSRDGGYGFGTVFRLTPAGNLTTLYDFWDNYSGAHPDGGLVLGTDGSFYGTTNWGGGHYGGTVFRIAPNGALTTLYNFCVRGAPCSDGYGSYAGLVQATDGNFYGTTANGGDYGYGTLFRITAAGGFRKLHSFCPQETQVWCPDGGEPQDSLIQGIDGNLYGTNFYGGLPNGFGTIFKKSLAGGLTTFYSFCVTDCSDGADPVAGLVQAADGNFYGTTRNGGLYGNGTVFQINPIGVLTTLYSFSGNDGASPYGALVQATDHKFYGTTAAGGAHGTGTVFQITAAGKLTTLHSLGGTDGASPLGGLFQATDGKLYGTTTQGGASNYGTTYCLDMGLGPFVRLLPTSGGSGQTIGILGQGLTGSTSVLFGSLAASFTVVSDTYLTAVVPTGATIAPVLVVTPSGPLTSNAMFRAAKPATSTTLASNLNPSIYGQGLTFTATVATGGPVPPTGKVYFRWQYFGQTFTLASVNLSSGGIATLTRSGLNADPYPMTAVYMGDVNNLGSTSPILNQTVVQTTSAATILASPNPSIVGEAVTFTTKITSPTVTPKGTVTFKLGTTVLGTVQLANGRAMFTTSTLPAGSYVVRVAYAGDSNIKGSSAALTQVVRP